MRFRVLGDTALETDGASATIGSERQRRLLAALVMGAPETVPTHRLIEAVWGDAQPDNTVNALRTVVTRLRHSLDDVEPDAGRRIVSRPPGYVLDVPVEAVDANRFADLAVAGRSRLAEGDLDGARRALSEALRVWRGPPYAEFAGEPWAQGEASRLDRLWVAVRKADIEARLAVGLHAEVLGDVQRLVDDEPLSDEPRGLLMRALFAGGRQAEALRALQEYRTMLAEETGLEPGPELLRLEERILANDPELLAPAGRALRGYRLHERLATTERGAVFRATQPGLERDVAIEVIREEISSDAAFVRSFEHQGRALARLGHAHVAPVYDCWREPGGAYLVRRLLSGGSLADPEVRERLGTEGLARVRAQVRSALDVAHQAGLVHGPIEAADVQLDDHDTAYLANFRLGATQATVEDDDRSFDRLFDGLVGPLLDAEGPVAPTRVGNPYRGLAAFREHDVDVFFGRTRLVEATLDALAEHGTAFVVGPSGSGKSSLVHAGVVPALVAGELDGSEDWFVVDMVPGADPFGELEAAVLRVAAHPPAGLLEQLRAEERSLAETIQRVLPEADATAVLVIDQFEELFAVTPEPERDRFLSVLGDAMSGPDRPLKVIATLRADFYDEPLARPQIAPIVTRATVPCDTLSGDELRAAIVEPGRVVGIDVEPELVAQLVADASGRAGTLPLLQYTLTQLFEDRRGDTLTLDAYLATGGLTAAVGSRAEKTYEALDPTRRATARRMFGRLVAVDTTADTRRRARLTELRAAENDPTDVDLVADRFVAARLLLTDRDPASREPTLEVAHESLLREWSRLAAWLREDRATIAALRHVGEAAAAWRASGDDSELYRGARLAAALDLVADHGDRLTPDEHAFVEAARRLAEAEQYRQRRTNRRLRGLLVAAGVLLVAALVAGLFANGQRRRADDRADEAREQATLAADAATTAQTAADAEAAARNRADLERLTALARSSGAVPQEVAILAGLEAHRIDPSPDTLEALHWALTADPAYRGTLGDTRMGGDITVLDDGGRIVTHTLGTIEVWDVADRTRDARWPIPGTEDVTSLRELRSTASGDGSLLVATAPGVTTVLDAASGEEVAAFEHPVSGPGPAVGVALSPDGSRLAIGLADGSVEIHDVDDSSAPVVARELDGATAPTLVWHPDGRRLAAGTTAGDVVLWDADRGENVATLTGTIAFTPVSSVGAAPLLLFSSDGTRLVVAGLDTGNDSAIFESTVLELASADLRRLATTTANIGGIRSLSWLDANETTVVMSGQSSARVVFVNLEDPTDVPRLHITNFEASASLPDLALIVSEAGIGLDLHAIDGSNRLVQRIPPPPAPSGPPGGMISTVLDPSGSQLLAGVGIGQVQVIDLGIPGATWEPYTDATGEPIGFAFGAGSRVITAGAGGWVLRNWDGDALSEPLPLPRSGIAKFATASPEGDRLMVTIGEQDTLFALDSPSGPIADLGTLGLPFRCCALPAFSTDGALLSRPDREGGTDLFDAATGEFVAFDHEIEAQLFGPRGTWFAAVDERGTIHLHDQQTGERVGQPMVGNRGPITYLLPTLDGRRLAAVGANGSTRVWDLETMTQVGRQIETTHPGFRSWSADGRFFSSHVVGADGVGRIEVWNLDTDTWPDLACELAGRNMTQDEWEQFGPRTVERRRTCPEHPLT